MKAYEKFASSKPRVGQTVLYRGEPVGTVTCVEGALCWCSHPDGESAPFIWCFKDGLNALHDWPSKNGPNARCPGISP